jgi:mitochondrial chaperone BCS1
MATFNDTSSPPIQLNPFPQVSILDLFFPGLTGILAAAQQLLAGNLNTYARLLCICGILVFLGIYVYKYLGELVADYFSLWLSSRSLG